MKVKLPILPLVNHFKVKITVEHLDEIDIKLLELLQGNARLTSKELSVHLNLSLSPIYERIRRLEKMGVIAAYHTVLDREKLGFDLVAYIAMYP